MEPRAHREEMDLPSPRNGATTRLAGDRGIGASHGQVEPVLGLRSNPRSSRQPRPQDRAEHGEAALEGSRYRAGTASPTKDDVGTISSESLGHRDTLAAADFFTTEIWTSAGLVTFYVFFVIQLKTRRVHLSTPTPNRYRVFSKQERATCLISPIMMAFPSRPSFGTLRACSSNVNLTGFLTTPAISIMIDYENRELSWRGFDPFLT